MHTDYRTRLKLAVGLLALWAAVLLAPNPAAADIPPVVQLLPADPAAFLVVPNLGQLDAKLIAFRDKLGLDPTDFPNPLEEFQNETGIKDGLNPNGSLLVVVPNIVLPNQDPNAQQPDAWRGEDPEFLLVVPVTDYNAFVANFQGKPDGKVTTLTMQHGEPGFAKQLQDYAVLGEHKETVEAYTPAMTPQALAQWVGPVGQHCVSACDTFVILNIAKLGPTIQAGLDQMIQEIDREITQEIPGTQPSDPQKSHLTQTVSTVTKIQVDSARAIIRDASAIVWGADLNDQGVGFWSSVQFKPGSFLAQIFPSGGGASTHLAKLANQPYLFACAANFKGLGIPQLLDELTQRLKGLDENSCLAPAMKAVDMARTVQGTAAVYYPPNPESASQSIFNAVALYQTPDSQSLVKQIQEYIELINHMSLPIPQKNAFEQDPALDNQPPEEPAGEPQNQPDAFSLSSTYTPAVMEIEGVKIDQYQTQMNFPQEMMMEMGPAAGMMTMLGLTRQSGFVAAKNDHVLITSTTDPQFMKQSLLSLAQNQGLGTHQFITQSRAQALPADPTLEFYISVPGLVQTANTFMVMFGGPPLDVPNHLPPVAGALSVQDSGLLARFYVPMSVITYCKSLPEQIAQQQQQQNQQPPPQQQRRQGGGPPPAPRS